MCVNWTSQVVYERSQEVGGDVQGAGLSIIAHLQFLAKLYVAEEILAVAKCKRESH